MERERKLDKVQEAYIQAVMMLLKDDKPLTDSNILICMMRNYERPELVTIVRKKGFEIRGCGEWI